jgi:hypothetical protein
MCLAFMQLILTANVSVSASIDEKMSQIFYYFLFQFYFIFLLFFFRNETIKIPAIFGVVYILLWQQRILRVKR